MRKLAALKNEHGRLPQANTKEGIMERAAKLREIGEKLHWVKTDAINLHTLSYMQDTLQEIVDEIESHPAYLKYSQRKEWSGWVMPSEPWEGSYYGETW